MAEFMEAALVCKLQELNSSQQSIQTLSLWLIHQIKHHDAVVKIWYKELLKTKETKQLTFMYLANDVILNSKKKGPEYEKSFGEVLIDAFKYISKTGINAETKTSLHILLSIWEENGVFDAEKIQYFKETVDFNDAMPKKVCKRKSIDVEVMEPGKKPRIEREEHKRRRSETEVEAHAQIKKPIMLNPNTPPGDLPNPGKLIKALLELDSIDLSNEEVRESIESLPPELSEVKLLTKLGGRITPYTRLNCILIFFRCYIKNLIFIHRHKHLLDE